jgi:hypothetical protein
VVKRKYSLKGKPLRQNIRYDFWSKIHPQGTPYHIEAARNAILLYIHETGRLILWTENDFLQGSPVLEENTE